MITSMFKIFFLLTILVVSCNQKEQQPPATPADGFTPGTVQNKVYDNAAYRFRFTVPTGWRLQEGRPVDGEESSILLVAGIHEKVLDSFMINAQKGFFRSKLTALQRLDHMFAATRKAPEFNEMARESLSCGGASAARLEYQVRADQKGESFYVFVHKDRTITFSSTAPHALSPPLKSDIESILASLEFY